MKYLNSSFLLILLTSAHALSAADPATWNLWPDTPPGEVVTLPPESDRTTDDSRLAAGKRVTRLQNVSVPTLTIYKPDSKIDTGASVIADKGFHRIFLGGCQQPRSQALPRHGASHSPSGPLEA